MTCEHKNESSTGDSICFQCAKTLRVVDATKQTEPKICPLCNEIVNGPYDMFKHDVDAQFICYPMTQTNEEIEKKFAEVVKLSVAHKTCATRHGYAPRSSQHIWTVCRCGNHQC